MFQQHGQDIRFNCTEKGVYYKRIIQRSTTLEISKVLRRDHCTIEKYVAASHQGRKKRVQPKFNMINDRQMRQIHRQVIQMPLASSMEIFDACHMPKMSHVTHCKTLREVAVVRKSMRNPPLKQGQKAGMGEKIHEN